MNKPSKTVRAMDTIVNQPFAPNKPLGDIQILGYTHLGTAPTIEAFIARDEELNTTNHHIVAVQQGDHFEFFTKKSNCN